MRFRSSAVGAGSGAPADRSNQGALVSLTLFGRFEVASGGRALSRLPTRKAEALLAYLASRAEQVHERSALALLLWGDSGDDHARHSLRQALLALRRALPSADPPLLRVAPDVVSLDASKIDVDVRTFERLVRAGSPKALEAAVGLYDGELLSGLRLREPPFEDWLATERVRLRHMAVDSLTRLLGWHMRADHGERALRIAERLLALDPLYEPAHRALMRLYAAQGRRSEAIRQYQACVRALERGLGVEPEADTRRAYHELLRAGASPVRVARPPRIAADGSAAAVAATVPRPQAPVLVGRAPELARLRQALERSVRGNGQVLVVLGEAGMGKSCLVGELGAMAAQAGARIVIGRAHESERILPLEPWVEALRDRTALRELYDATDAPREWCHALAHVLPELGGHRDAAVPRAWEYRRLFEVVAEVFGRIGSTQPTVVLLEDLHWADEMSVRLFAFLGRRCRAWPLLLVATARPEELGSRPLCRRILDELERDGVSTPLELTALSEADTGALVRRLGGRGARGNDALAVTRQIWELSRGRPFMIVETVGALHQRAALPPPDGLPLARRIRDHIAGRLECLSRRGQQVVAVASAIGRAFDFPLLQRASGLSEEGAASAVEELLRSRVLQAAPPGFEFTHHGIREVAYGRIVAPRRVLLHRRIADAIESLHGGELEAHAGALARHFEEAGVRDKAMRYLRQARAATSED